MAAKKKATKKATAKKPAAKKATKRTAPKKPAARAKATAAKAGIVHWEIQAKDPARIQRFYAEIFGWKIDANNPMNYGMVDSKKKDAIAGGIGGSPSGQSRLLVYADVPDIHATLAKVESLGGRTIMPRTDIGPVIMGIFEDVEGNQFGLVEA